MVKKISKEELKDMMCSGKKLVLVDVLDKEHFEKEHIKGAISIPLNEIEMKAPKMLNNDDSIVVYCASFDCLASTNAAGKLMSMGYKNVLDYKGGIKEYKEANWPLEGGLHEAAKEPCLCSVC